MLKHFKKLDWTLIIVSFLLVGIGLISIYSISLKDRDFSNFNKQIIFYGIGVILMFFLSFYNWKSFKNNPYLILIVYFVCIVFLIGLFFFAPEIRGVKSWYRIGPPGGGFSFDPIGLTTVILIILLSKFFSMRHIEIYKLRHIFLSGFYVFIPFILIAKQPDLGSAFILLALWVGILIISGIKMRHFLALILIGIIIFSLSWGLFLKEYQKERIVSFLTPQLEPLGMNWSQIQSKIAIGSGGIFGKGFGQGSQTQSGFLSEPHTDFIFSVIAEEFGLMGVFVLLFLFAVLIWRIMKIAVSAQSNFPRLFASGIAIVLFFQIFIHIGMNIGIMPVVGLSLPLISYGGSSLIAIFIGFGILQSIKTH